MRKFDERSKHFPLDDHYINSYHIFFRLIIRKKLMLVTSGPKGLIIVIVDTTAAHALYVVGQLIVFLVVV